MKDTKGKAPARASIKIAKGARLKFRIFKDCILYRFPPEIRKHIYKAILAKFFEEGGHDGEIHYVVDEFGQTYPCMGKYIDRDGKRIWAGLGEKRLPPFELALLPDL
jgi:hypothetical protein